MTPLLMSSLPISISHWLFRCKYSNYRDAVASSPFFSCPSPERPGEFARRLDIYIMSFPPCSLSATQYSYQHLSLYIFSLPRFNFILGADFTFLCVYRKNKICIKEQHIHLSLNNAIPTCNKQKTKSACVGSKIYILKNKFRKKKC